MTNSQREALAKIVQDGGPVLYLNTGPKGGWWLGTEKLNGNVAGALERHKWIVETKTSREEASVRDGRTGPGGRERGRRRFVVTITEYEVTDAGREAVGPTPMCVYEDAGLGCTGDDGHQGQHVMGRITSV